jgi:acetylornithine deacetylase/succinyl-diaminopimelate desuccinylase-like protein
VTIKGFYDDVLDLTEEERTALNKHGMPDADLLASTGSPCPTGEAGYSTPERIGARPSLDVNGIVGGYTADGAATVVPVEASAKISMRLVANQDPAKISQAFDAAVQSACPEGVTVTITDHASCPAYMGKKDSPAMRAAISALEATFGSPPVFTREGGTLPILPMFQEVLKADSIMLGFADPDCNLHSPNEFFRLSDFYNGTRCVLRFLEAAAAKSA